MMPGGDHQRPGHSFPRLEEGWVTLVVQLDNTADIQMINERFEGYDNLALVRTPKAGSGILYIYTWEPNEQTARSVLLDLSADVGLRVIDRQDGMYEIEELWNEPRQ